MAAREELDVWWQRNDAAHTVLRVMHSPLSRYEIVSRVPRFPRHGASTRPAEFCPVGISGPCRSFFVPGPKEEQRNEKEGEGEREREKRTEQSKALNLIGRRRVAAWPTQFVQPVKHLPRRRSLCVSTMMNVYTSCAAREFSFRCFS